MFGLCFTRFLTQHLAQLSSFSVNPHFVKEVFSVTPLKAIFEQKRRFRTDFGVKWGLSPSAHPHLTLN